MRNLLFINNGYPTHANPNHSTYAKTIANCIEQSGCELDLLVVKFNKKISPFYKLVKYFIYWIKLFVVNLNKYDKVYVNHAPFAWPIFWNFTFRKNKNKLYIHWHGDDAVNNTRFLKVTRDIVKNATKECFHIAPSMYFKKLLVDELGLNTDKIVVSPSGGVDVSVFKAETRPLGVTINLGFASGMSVGKGADLIMALVDNVENIETQINRKIIFKIIDYGSDILKYHNKLDKHKHVILIPTMSKSQMPDYYSQIDILIMGSRRKSESLGLVVLEAMSCGKPVVTFNDFAFPEFVKSGISGEMVDFSDNFDKNVESFMDAIVKIYNNYSAYNPREIVEKRYSKEYVIEQYKEMFGC